MPPVGNDIVDLTDTANKGKSRDTRFINRVYTTKEQRLIRGAARPDAVLWALWAGKESAYKVISKGLLPAVPSTPRLYEVTLASPHDSVESGENRRARSYFSGQVRTPCGVVPVRIVITAEYVHCLAARFLSDPRDILRQVTTLEPEVAASADGPSRHVRQMAVSAIARRLNRPICDITISRPPVPAGMGPPLVFVEDRPTGINLSFSHDGRFAAWAMILPKAWEFRTNCLQHHRCEIRSAERQA